MTTKCGDNGRGSLLIVCVGVWVGGWVSGGGGGWDHGQNSLLNARWGFNHTFLPI